jgi:hypothetical protein
MPIRMTDDDDSNDRDDSGGGGGGGSSSGGGGSRGGGGGGLSIFELVVLVFQVIPWLFRHPKLTLLLVVLGGGYFYFSGRSSASGPSAPSAGGPPSAGPAAPSSGTKDPNAMGTGATLDPKVYDTALVHEPLADTGNPALPERVSLLQYAPPRRSQGHQGSCVGWATSYAARSILYARQTGEDPAKAAFSPAFVYNQISRPGCNGTYLVRALEELQTVGDLPFDDFAYDQDSCSHKPSREEKSRAAAFRIRGFDRLSVDASDYRTNTDALKQHLLQNAPVVIGMNVGGTFQTAMRGTRVWHPTRDDYAMRGDWGGHAMAVIGYDDTVEGGAFQVMNSWGPTFGDDGVFFVRYKDFDHFVKEAYGLYPMGDAHARDAELRIHFGLTDNATHRHLALKAQDGTTWRTKKPIAKGTRFKVEFSNTRPVYTYLFGQETDGSSYVLFPYSEKHNPYCGTVGTRVFPRKQSLTADNLGTRDSIAVLISPEPLDFKELNQRITSAPGASYAKKLASALGNRVSTGVKISETRDDLLELVAGPKEADKLYTMVIEFDKK